MDANEFLKKVQPARQHSRLAPFWNDINKLQQSGCTLKQVVEFLKTNGVQISIAGLSKYIKRREEKGEKGEQPRAPAAPGKLDGMGAKESPPVGIEQKQEQERPPGLSNAAWSELQIKRAKAK